MADERDPQISQRYRELGAEEPSPELDRAILAAARRATRRHRWYSSLAAAAVLIFAVALVVQIERQPPDQVPMSTPAQATAPAAQDKVAPQEREAPAAKPAPRRRVEEAPRFAPEPPPRAAPAPEPNANEAAPAAGVAAGAEQKRADENRAAPTLQRPMAASRSAAANLQADVNETPDQWLARIVRMRALGRDDEADKELARFRERYPDYRMSAAMAKKVEKQTPAAPAK
jgi:outer membrane biosynthesis protein TonB